MKKYISIILVVVMALSITLYITACTGSESTDHWEYKVLFRPEGYSSHEEIEKELNDLGEDGWELVILYDYHTYYFKRKLP